MAYCAALYCNANSSNNKVTCWFKFPTQPKKPTKHSQLCSLRENLFRLRSGPEMVVALDYVGAKTL